MSYQQLTEGKRYQIAALIAQGLRPSEIARIINVHRFTVYRELRRNRQERQYDPAQAHALTQQRRYSSAKYDGFVRWVEMRLNLRPRKCFGFKQHEAGFQELVQAV